MINFQELEKIAEFKNGELNWLEGRDINAVYVILVGDEYYIGSSHYTYLRIGQHLDNLLKGDHHSCKLQEKFNEVGEFEVYSLDRGIHRSMLQIVESEYIHKYQPTLNMMLAESDRKGDLVKARIKELISKKGLTISELASIIGTTQTSISRMLGKNGNPTYNSLVKIAEALGIGLYGLLQEGLITCPKCGAKFDLRKEEE